jgi:Fe2+ or Zn2+ uptake regulation protein
VSRRIDPELLRKQLLDVLAAATEPLTTAQLRSQLPDADVAVNEHVYRNLVVLERRDRVRRLRPGGRHVAWERAIDTTKGPRHE